MDLNQITRYEYCRKHLEFLDNKEKLIPFEVQKYGCGSSQPPIEFELEKIHQEMYSAIHEAIKEAKVSIEKIVESI